MGNSDWADYYCGIELRSRGNPAQVASRYETDPPVLLIITENWSMALSRISIKLQLNLYHFSSHGTAAAAAARQA